MIVANDSATDNWTGEYAMLLANSGGPPLAGIIVNPSPYSPDLATNVGGWNQLIAAARASGLRNIPDATASAGDPLVRPADGAIESHDAEHVGRREADPRSVRAPEPARGGRWWS